MRVAILTPLYPSVEAPTHGMFIRDQALALARSGVDVVVLHVLLRSPRNARSIPIRNWHEGLDSSLDEGVMVHRWSGWSAGRGSVPRIMRAGARHLVESIRGPAPDIVHGHFAYGGGEAGAVAAQAYGAPLVLTEHSSEYARGMMVGRPLHAVARALARTDALIAVSSNLAEDIEAILGARATVIPNVVDVDAFPPRTASRGAGRMFHLLSVGSLETKKGYDLLLTALASLGDSGWHATIVGKGSEGRHLRSLADELRIGQRITWMDALPRERISGLMEEVDVFVSSSRHETFGVAIAEALSRGLPVVATDGGASSFVEEPYGLVFPPEPLQLAAGIKRVMEGACAFDPRESHARIRAMFGGGVIAHRICEVYSGVLRGG